MHYRLCSSPQAKNATKENGGTKVAAAVIDMGLTNTAGRSRSDRAFMAIDSFDLGAVAAVGFDSIRQVTRDWESMNFVKCSTTEVGNVRPRKVAACSLAGDFPMNDSNTCKLPNVGCLEVFSLSVSIAS